MNEKELAEVEYLFSDVTGEKGATVRRLVAEVRRLKEEHGKFCGEVEAFLDHIEPAVERTEHNVENLISRLKRRGRR